MKKSHPMRRVLLASAATVSGIVLLLSLKPSSDPGAPPAQSVATQGQTGAQAVGNSQTRTLTGDVEQTQYGPVQVRVTVSGGKITTAEAVQNPSGGRSTQISSDAIPKLNKAAVAAGSTDIDTVSGATYTSAGYRKSLQSALDKADGAPGSGSGAEESGDQKPGSPQESGGRRSGRQGPGAGSAQARGETLQGEVVKTEYGPVQIRVTLSGGKITKAEAVQMPMGGRSTQISVNAIPELNREAVAAGSADIDAVSGATYTSEGYRKSLQSALDHA
jgi:uncharacterized protein with FMN-binding domain